MSGEQPTIDSDSWLSEGHRWIWVPLLITTGLNVVASLVIALVVG